MAISFLTSALWEAMHGEQARSRLQTSALNTDETCFVSQMPFLLAAGQLAVLWLR